MKEYSKQSSTGARPRSHVFGFLDETGLLHTPPTDRFFGLGLVILQSPRRVHRAIIRLRNQRKFYNEFKFSTIDHSNLPVYQNFIDIVLGAPNLRFNCVIVDKTKHNTRDNYLKRYNWLAGNLIAHSIDQTNDQTSEYITILADDVSTNNIDDQFERIIRNAVKKITRRNALFGVARLESHAVTELQICDVLIGAVAYAHKMAAGTTSTKNAKAQFVKYIQKKMNAFSLSRNLELRLHSGVMFRIEQK